ncbi:uncharacterized protein AAGF69_015838 isoform 2-T2 [Amazona ochrocephala]
MLGIIVQVPPRPSEGERGGAWRRTTAPGAHGACRVHLLPLRRQLWRAGRAGFRPRASSAAVPSKEPSGARRRFAAAGCGRLVPGLRHGSLRGPAAHEQALYYQVLNFAMIVSSALMIWKGLIVVTGSESPIVVVLSGSMEPAFHRGDLLFLTNFHDDPIRAGEIVVFKVEGRDIPIVHRVIKVHEKKWEHQISD